MSNQNLASCDLYSRPPEIDNGAYLRIRQIRPVERAAAPIVDHNIELIETALGLRPWYRDETRVKPSTFMSLLLDPARNSAITLLSTFADTVNAFAPGSFPGHCHAVRELEFTTKHLINTLATLVDTVALANSLKCLGAFFAAIADPANVALSKHDLAQRIGSKRDALFDSFRLISREFAIREREIVFCEIPGKADARTDELLAVAKETNAVVKRIDARDVKRSKRQVEIDRQEKCWAIWEAGRGKEAVMAIAGKRRVSRNDVFDYYKRELNGIGVKKASEFTALLKRRERRLSRCNIEP